MANEFALIAQAGSFDELNALLQADSRQLNSGDRVRFAIDLNWPIGNLFNVPGAELIFNPVMPPGLILDDVSGSGSTVVVEAHATSPMLAAVGAWLAAHWTWVTLGAIGISIGLAALMASISFLVMSITSPEAAVSTTKWLAIGALGLATIGIVAYGAKKKGYI